MAIDNAGKFLYVTFTYQPGFTPASPRPRRRHDLPDQQRQLARDAGHRERPAVSAVGNNPVGITVTPPICSPTPVIADQHEPAREPAAPATRTSSSTSSTRRLRPTRTVLGYAQNTSTGALTPLSGTTFNTTLNTWQGYHAGVTPSAIVADPTGRFVYVTDKTSNLIIGFSIDNQLTGNLTATRLQPLRHRPRTPCRSSSIPAASTSTPPTSTAARSAPSPSTRPADRSPASPPTGSFQTGTRPSCVTIDPALGIYLYTSNYLSGDVSAGQLSPNTGALYRRRELALHCLSAARVHRLRSQRRRTPSSSRTHKATRAIAQYTKRSGPPERFALRYSNPQISTDATDSLAAVPYAPIALCLTPQHFTLGGITLGGGPLFLIAGPCVIESEPHARRMADAIQRIASGPPHPLHLQGQLRQGQPHLHPLLPRPRPRRRRAHPPPHRRAEPPPHPHRHPHRRAGRRALRPPRPSRRHAPDPRFPLPPDRSPHRDRPRLRLAQPRRQRQEGPVRRPLGHAPRRRKNQGIRQLVPTSP